VLKIRVPLEVRTEHAHRLLGKTVTRIEWRSRDLSEEKYDRHHSGRQQKKSRNRAMGMGSPVHGYSEMTVQSFPHNSRVNKVQN
jgi:hypothetical protein